MCGLDPTSHTGAMTAAVVPMARFQPFSGEHFVLIGIFLLGCVLIALVGRALRGTEREPAFRRAFAVVIPLFTVPMQVLQLLPGDFTLGTSLPFQVCDLAWILAVVALSTRNRWATELLYYWGLVLVPLAIATPSLQQAFPDPRYFMFWGMHFLSVWAAVYLTFGLGIRPTWPGFRRTVGVTLVWALVVMAFNGLTGTNYGYFNRKPSVATPLDLLGPWPTYVILEMAIILAVFALITWPWTIRRHVGSDATLVRR
jgi:hypothetical integral membrane protein (TIGR02206 family)